MNNMRIELWSFVKEILIEVMEEGVFADITGQLNKSGKSLQVTDGDWEKGNNTRHLWSSINSVGYPDF